MQAIQDIFAAWPSIKALAEDIGQIEDTVRRWRNRGRIPPEHFPSIVKAAAKVGRELTTDDLLLLNRPPKKRGWPAGKPRVRRRKRLS